MYRIKRDILLTMSLSLTRERHCYLNSVRKNSPQLKCILNHKNDTRSSTKSIRIIFKLINDSAANFRFSRNVNCEKKMFVSLACKFPRPDDFFITFKKSSTSSHGEYFFILKISYASNESLCATQFQNTYSIFSRIIYTFQIVRSMQCVCITFFMFYLNIILFRLYVCI